MDSPRWRAKSSRRDTARAHFGTSTGMAARRCRNPQARTPVLRSAALSAPGSKRVPPRGTPVHAVAVSRCARDRNSAASCASASVNFDPSARIAARSRIGPARNAPGPTVMAPPTGIPGLAGYSCVAGRSWVQPRSAAARPERADSAELRPVRCDTAPGMRDSKIGFGAAPEPASRP
jgi:hypothetical protein